jgi:SNF2 family DNA or RNA helicase
MKHTLLPHQIEDAAFLASRSFAGNFSGMGSGKTLTALEAAKQVTEPTVDRIIIIGPPISLTMWKAEAEEYLPHCIATIITTGKQVINEWDGVFIMSYQIATKRRDELKALGAKVLICDEAHALFKIKMHNYTKKPDPSQRTKAILGAGGLCESVEYAWFLTGTPSTRYSCDLWSFLCRADMEGLKKRVGSDALWKYYLRYCITQQKKFSAHQRTPATVVVGNRNTEELNEWLFDGGLAVRRELKEVFENMPPLTINHLQVQLDTDPELRRMLKAMEKQTMSQIQEDIGRKEEHISTLRRKIGAAKVKHSVAEIIDRVEAGITPILVGAVHHDVIDALVDALRDKNVNVGVIDGRTSAPRREDAITAFQEGTLDVLVGQIQAMGVAITLTGGSHVICVETTFSPAEQDQFYARCHRIGQKDHVHVDVFEAADCKLEAAIRRILATKARGHATMMEQTT